MSGAGRSGSEAEDQQGDHEKKNEKKKGLRGRKCNRRGGNLADTHPAAVRRVPGEVDQSLQLM